MGDSEVEGAKQLYKGVNAFGKAGLGRGWEEEYLVVGSASKHPLSFPSHLR